MKKERIKTVSIAKLQKDFNAGKTQYNGVKIGDVVTIDGEQKKVVKASGKESYITKVCEGLKELDEATKKTIEAGKKAAEAEKADAVDYKTESFFDFLLTIKAPYIKAGKMDDVKKAVHFIIADSMTSKVKATYTKTKKQIEKLHQVDADKLSDDEFFGYALECEKKVKKVTVKYTDEDAEDAVAARARYFAMKQELETLTDEKKIYTALTAGQKNKVTLIAMMNYNGLVFDSNLLLSDEVDEDGKPKMVDFQPLIRRCFEVKDFNRGFEKMISKVLRPVIFKAFGTDDSMFYAIDATEAQLKKAFKELRFFVSQFINDARLLDDGSYDYSYKAGAAMLVKELFKLVNVLIGKKFITIKK